MCCSLPGRSSLTNLVQSPLTPLASPGSRGQGLVVTLKAGEESTEVPLVVVLRLVLSSIFTSDPEKSMASEISKFTDVTELLSHKKPHQRQKDITKLSSQKGGRGASV